MYSKLLIVEIIEAPLLPSPLRRPPNRPGINDPPSPPPVLLVGFPAYNANGRFCIRDLMGPPVFDSCSTRDNTTCSGWLNSTLPKEHAGRRTYSCASSIGNASNMQPRIRFSGTVVGAVVVTVRLPPNEALATWVDDIRFDSRVLYPTTRGATGYRRTS
ncbi:hypothetical protein GPECTOR_60g705 [Gonium pectorale]|uniref:Uncharacterized protein n=1 Tax=Gonium pectorale TaxID=33097 RepID=A0A150G528_GONPE|nr:hypothetical protein GPECTOR_60g705 [Gonium pectorale]|eukprot:KXZ44928.1 hypothetical protein GPECTOR_60g705 [Gonium pectorale]